MAIGKHIEEFHGLPVFDFFPEEEPEQDRELPAPGAAAWRVGLDYDAEESFEERWTAFLDAVECSEVRAVVIGPWWAEDYEPLTEALAAIVRSAGRLPALRALFIGDVTYEECEISWLQMTDVTPVLESFPQLEELVVRGASGDYDGKSRLALRPVRHDHLRALRFEAGGLPGEVVRAVGECELPALERLELWLGLDEYGGDASISDLAPFLAGARFPALRHLGLENSEIQDQIAEAVSNAPVVAQLERLSLALGTLTDEGAIALLAGQPLTHLKSLDLHHHFLSEELQQRLRDTLGAAGVDLDLSKQKEPDDDWRYVANGE
ncbi:STM4015 family protein [Kitasatospora atroaurantiaca]|uniref:Leucine rich repeat (LRR) protein n=1 Tax=Kitasatospora atroaurantiaca TaxID=285545 RepID=A0A561EV47_9ACTN|nr:STM4015 family protein [Kitasatospora atroaurantiaca]TWE19485.1 hypothetical protein FB465_4602 [Kitasatospora atroaurantiaca]